MAFLPTPKPKPKKGDWKKKAAQAKTPAEKQKILIQRAASVGRIGKKARANRTALAAKKKAGTLTTQEAEQLKKLRQRAQVARGTRKASRRRSV